MRKMMAALAALCVLPTMAGAQNLIVNGGFESPGVTAGSVQIYGSGGTIGDSSGGWTVGGGSGTNAVMVVSNSYTEPGSLTFPSHGGVAALDLTGQSNSLTGYVQQTAATLDGVHYTLSFWLGNEAPNAKGTGYSLYYQRPSALALWINGTLVGTFNNATETPGTTNWKQFSYEFTAHGATTVKFVNDTSGSDNYAGLDDVVLVGPDAVPEATTWAMMIGGIGLMGGALRRRRSQVAVA